MATPESSAPAHPAKTQTNTREDRARDLAERNFSEIAQSHDKGAWSVPSCTGLSIYTVHYRRHSTHPDEGCSCPDFSHRGLPCKHLLAVALVAKKSTPCWDCGTRYRTRDLVEVVDEHLEFNPFTFFGGEMLCPRCARRHGLL